MTSFAGAITLSGTQDYVASEFASATLKSDVYSYSKIYSYGIVWRIIEEKEDENMHDE